MFKVLVVLCCGAGAGAAAQSGAGAVAYGKYLVEEVAKCQDCHTPRTSTGELDKTKWLKGAMVDFQPDRETKQWRKLAPDVTSSSDLFKTWREDGMVKYLETGLGPHGHPANPPMPAYKLRPHDAQAIVAYLKTLK
jgi:Cytochrome c